MSIGMDKVLTMFVVDYQKAFGAIFDSDDIVGVHAEGFIENISSRVMAEFLRAVPEEATCVLEYKVTYGEGITYKGLEEDDKKIVPYSASGVAIVPSDD